MIKLNFVLDDYDEAIVKQFQKNFLEFFNAEVTTEQTISIALYEFGKNRKWKVEQDGDRISIITDGRGML